MSIKNSIRVIKRGETGALGTVDPAEKEKINRRFVNHLDETSKIVSSWVHEFKRRQRTDAKQAFNGLFEKSA